MEENNKTYAIRVSYSMIVEIEAKSEEDAIYEVQCDSEILDDFLKDAAYYGVEYDMDDVLTERLND